MFLVRGAPDLALTQFLVETMTLVVVVLVLRRMPARFVHGRTVKRARLLRVAVSGAVGVLVTCFALATSAARTDPAISPGYIRRAASTGAHNVVDAILVDFRALDTLGEISVLLVATAVVAAFSLPPVLPGAVPRPLPIVRLLAHLLADLVRSGTTVAWQVVRHGRRTSAAIIEVQLRVDSDLLITAVAELTTMTPGTLVAEIDRRRRRLYVHVLPVRGPEDITRHRDAVRAVERRVARAVGTTSDADDTNRHTTAHGTPGDTPQERDPGQGEES
ncbi:hydrogen gas-evolving membrane-bound hydrogenase subunit E [Streptomyces sp. NPDC053499]|uniref:Na+/H+ antiporter subunit E n=1 Tax=Streptomyces sp. NPDC053499 TaxID=3365707 RepID=UPI0037D196E7